MKNKQNRILVHIITNIFIFFVLIFGILLYSHRENYNRQITHINQYIGEMSTRTAEHVGDVFQDKADAIASIAYLYGTSLKSPKVDLEYLKEVEDNSGFDWIRFIDPDGDDYTSQGMLANVADREYFRKGINGQSGISIVERSRVSGERLLGFYAPVRYQNKICGVMVGFLQENTVSKILETVLYGYPTNTVIIDREGQLVGKYMQEDMQSLDSIDTLIKRITKEEREDVWKAIASNQKLRYSFQGDRGGSIGYLMPVKGTEWSLMQFFPSEATDIIVSGVNQDEHLVMILFGVVIFLFCMQLIYFLKRKKDIDSARENRNKLTSLLQSVSDDYICLIDVNLETEMEERFRMFGGEHLEDWAKGNYNYNDCIRNYAEKFVSAKDRKRFLEATTLETLKSVLARQRDFYIEYDAVIGDQPCRLQG
ncbi:cache domain-containing protein [Jutongia sp.]